MGFTGMGALSLSLSITDLPCVGVYSSKSPSAPGFTYHLTKVEDKGSTIRITASNSTTTTTTKTVLSCNEKAF
jgi:hypothetical protein